MSVGKLENASISIKPSLKLTNFIKELQTEAILIPAGIKNSQSNTEDEENKKPVDHQYLMTDSDYRFINSFAKESKTNLDCSKKSDLQTGTSYLNLEHLQWLYARIKEHNKESNKRIYFHDLFEDSEIILPKNVQIPRNPELEKRCKLLKTQQDNKQYKNMTKNVDNVRKHHPEDTISYQVKQLNKQLIAVAQFIFSVLAGFAFGFIGLEFMFGNLDFGFRLLLGIICALVIALAELYFLAKKLNEEINFEAQSEEMNKKPKLN